MNSRNSYPILAAVEAACDVNRCSRSRGFRARRRLGAVTGAPYLQTQHRQSHPWIPPGKGVASRSLACGARWPPYYGTCPRSSAQLRWHVWQDGVGCPPYAARTPPSSRTTRESSFMATLCRCTKLAEAPISPIGVPLASHRATSYTGLVAVRHCTTSGAVLRTYFHRCKPVANNSQTVADPCAS